MNIRKNNGITLITLIVTIVVLLIVSGVTIANITGGENTIDKANEAKLSTEVKSEMEEIQKKIDSSAAKGIKYGNFSGSIDASTIKSSLNGLVIDTSMITGNGPWQVTGIKTGTKYLIKQSYEVIPMPENTGTKTEMGVKKGDYVNYKAGNWTQEDIDKLKNLYSGEKIPDSTTPYTFGGFKVGQSKDIGITKGENNESIQDNEHAGWRVLKINDDGSVNIIHSGCPEWYYHPRNFNYKYDWARSSARSQLILGEGKIEGVDESAYDGIFERNWKMYENSIYAVINSARSVVLEELKSPSGSYSGSSVWYKFIGINFWTSRGFQAGGGIYWCKVTSTTEASANTYGYDASAGIRPVLTLKPECLFQNINDESTATHTTQETAWNLVI